MKIEPATILVIVIGSVSVVFLLLPLLIVLSQVRGVLRTRPGTGLLLSGVIILTAAFFAVFFVGLLALIFSGAGPK